MKKEIDIVVIGAGPVGLFTVFEAGLLGLKCILIDNLDKVGGQCAELYPEKPIYDIPGVPFQTAQEHVDALVEQIKPFEYEVFLNQRVDELEKINNDDGGEFWSVKTNANNEFITKNVFIAAGAGSFEPRRPPNIDDPDQFKDKGVTYAVRSKETYVDKKVFIFGGGDSALDWTIELSKIAKDSFKALGGKSLGRIDIKMDHLGIPHFIEANLMPGLLKGYFFRACNLNLDMSYDDMIFSIANTGLSSN